MLRKQNAFQGLTEKLNALKVAIYIRVSTQWQVDKDSLQVQRRELIAYAEMVLGITDYVIFEDPGYSAKNTDRPDYQKMMSRLRTGEFSHLLVWKIDRISRNLLDFSQMYKELKDLGIVFVSKNEQFDTSNAIGEAMLKIILVFAELERNMTSERVTAVMMSRASNGQWNGGRVAYGYSYNKEEKTFSLVPAESKVVKLMFNLYEQYQSVLYISRYLNDANIKTRSGKTWSGTTVYGILTNPFYKGCYVYNVHAQGDRQMKRDESEWITVENHHEPTVSEVQFDRVQFSLKRNKRGGVPETETYVRKNIHIFAGMVFCGDCGSKMSATLDRRRADGWRPSIYGCSMRRNNSGACNNKYISDATLGPFVFNYIANIIRAKETIKKRTTVATLQNKLLRGPAFDEIDHIDETTLQSLYELLLSGQTGMEYKPSFIHEKSDAVMSEQDFLKQQKRKCETALARLQSLYLYGEEQLPEKDFVLARKKITDELKEIDDSLSKLAADESSSDAMSDEFIQKASYFIMVEKLLDERFIDYEKYIRSIEPSIPRNFISTVVSKIIVKDGRVMQIDFKNGMSHKFTYKN